MLDNIPPSWIAGCAMLLVALVILVYWSRKPRYRRQSIMTANEREFYGRLLAACPDCQIWPQVPILALLRPEAKEGSRTFWVAFRRVSNSRVDWVVAQDHEVVAVVELDDRSHDARKDALRDQILKSCGYRVVRFPTKPRANPQQIRETIFPEG